MKQIFILVCAVVAMAASSDKKPGKPKPVKTTPMLTAKDSFSYAFGAYCGGMIQKFNITSLNMDIFNAAVMEGMVKGDTGLKFDKELLSKVLNTYTMEAKYGKNKSDGIAFLNKKKTEGYTVTASGLMYKILKAGNGIKARPTDTALVYYTGRYTDSTIFDSNIGKRPFKTAFNGGAIKGFLEALLLMDEGAEAEIVVPYDLAYGVEGSRNPYTGEMNIEPYRTLTFVITLSKIIYRE